MDYKAEDYEVIVIGAGHAGCEAALASARIGLKTLLLTLNLDSVAMMPCNPAIGGTGKGQLVREIDALGGEMGKNIDETMIQARMLNTGKGPAVHSLRAQADKKAYQTRMKKVIEETENLTLRQQEATELIIEDNQVKGVKVKTGATYSCKSIVIATGTYLKSRIFIGEVNYEGGPNGLFPATELSDSLIEQGFHLQRFKTGTPARVDSKSLDYSKMMIQEGDEVITPFSFETEEIKIDQKPCWLTYTNPKAHQIILDNLDRSPLYTGDVTGIGPRYCPSIETKVMRFSDKDRHQIFIEPEGLTTNEMYVQGMSSCLPEEIQIQVYRQVPGLEHCDFMRSAYAIEYDCIEPTELTRSLESKRIHGLFFAGQINGTSGYEEAAAQGIVAGINAARFIRHEEPLILGRDEAYTGVLIDDIITKGTNEPYRMMTSRAEYRLLLRQDNADERLTPKGKEVGLVDDKRWSHYLEKQDKIDEEIERLANVHISVSDENNQKLEELGMSPIRSGISLLDYLKRPEVDYEKLRIFDPERPELSRWITQQVEVRIKYDGYIKKQLAQVERFKKLETRKIPKELDYKQVKGLRLEAQEKLEFIRPETMGQASRISGVSPADISVLQIYLESQKKK